jgi:peptidoglycan/LPS O-acetylase OafA/YrhL
MPILAFGEYSARPKLSDPGIQSAAAVPFTYYPLHMPFLVAGLAVLAGVVRALRRTGGYSIARYAVLVPGVVGILLMQWEGAGNMGEMIFALGLALLIPTAVFLTWRILRAKRTLPAVILVPLVAAILLAAGFLDQVIQYGAGTLVQFLIGGLVFAWPVMALRFVCRKRVSRKRIGVSLLVGFVPIFAFFIFLLSTQGGGGWVVMLFALGITMAPTLITAACIRWNAWARDIVTGNPAAFGAGPEPTTTVPGEAPAAG